jgi:hypothetical protein
VRGVYDGAMDSSDVKRDQRHAAAADGADVGVDVAVEEVMAAGNAMRVPISSSTQHHCR